MSPDVTILSPMEDSELSMAPRRARIDLGQSQTPLRGSAPTYPDGFASANVVGGAGLRSARTTRPDKEALARPVPSWQDLRGELEDIYIWRGRKHKDRECSLIKPPD